MSDSRHREFLEKLASDDQFRGELERRPREVMEEYGVPYKPDQVPDPVVLLSKAEVQAHLDASQGPGGQHRSSCLVPVPVFPGGPKGGKGPKNP